MSSEEIEDLVKKSLAEYIYVEPEPGTTVGKPWSASKVQQHIEQLRTALVKPHLQRFVLMDTFEQMQATQKSITQLWVVAEANGYCVFYDPTANEYGLAEAPSDQEPSTTIGVRGDLVGVFCAM